MATIKLLEEDASTLIGVLPDVIQCMVTEERNGNFELTMQYPNQKQYSDQLLKGKVIQCNAADELLNQKFRIFNTRKTMRNIIEVQARHISFDLVYDFLKEISIINQPCSYALNEIFRNSNFSKHYQGFSDIVNVQNYSVNKVNCLEAIGGTEGSIIDTYGTGAEILRDNTNIHVLNKRGHDNGVHITYSKNMTDINIEEDSTDLITRIYAYAIHKDTQSGTETTIEAPNGGYVDSPRINSYEHPFIRAIDFSDKFEEAEVPTPAKVQYFAEKYFRDNTVDLPKITYKLGFVPLSKTTEGGPKDDIRLCDIVYVDDKRYNIQTQAKAIKTTFNVLKNRYESIELGQPRSTLGSLIGSGEGTQGPPGPAGPQGPPGADGNIGDFPDSLPVVPQLTLTQLGMSSIQCDWTFENKVYYTYQLYASKLPNFDPTSFDLIHEGQASSFLFAGKPGETWYFRVRAGNTHNKWTFFSSEMSITLDKASQMDNYFTSAAIGQAVVGSLTADYMSAGVIKGQWIDAKNLSVTDGNGKRTFNVDSFGRVYMDVTSLQISSKDVALKETVDGKISKGQAIADINVTPGSVKIDANKIDISGTTTIGSSSTGRYVEIQNETFRVMNGQTPCMHMGYRTWQDYDGVPQFLMGRYGFVYSDQPNAPYSGTYFGMITYGYDKNPESTNPYHSIYYRSRTRAQETQLNFYEDGRTKLNSMGEFALLADGATYIVANKTDGLNFENGFKAGKYKNCEFEKNILINDSIFLNGSNQGITIGKYFGKEEYQLRKSTEHAMDLGHESFKFRNIYATNGTINTSDIRLKENIQPIQDVNIVPYNFAILDAKTSDKVLTKNDYHDFVKKLPFYSYDYIDGLGKRDSHNIGFIAQDIAETDVGKEFIFKDSEGLYQYNLQAYIGVLGVALQKEINKNEQLEKRIEILENLVKNIVK